MGVTDLVPKIEGFQPIPNSIMVPFMETQSAALAYAFGLNYEYGKRKIKSMDNDTFNSLTSEQIENMASAHTKVLLEGFVKKIPMALTSQQAIFDGYYEIETKKIETNYKLAQWMLLNVGRLIADNQHAQTQYEKDQEASGNQSSDFLPKSGEPAYNPYPVTPPTTSRREPTGTGNKNILLAQIKDTTVRAYNTLTVQTAAGTTQNTREKALISLLFKQRDALVKRYLTEYSQTTTNKGLLSQAINAR